MDGYDFRDIEQRLCRGEYIPTQELVAAHSLYERLRNDLGKLGQRWHFPLDEASRLEAKCRTYLHMRESRTYE